MTDQREGTEAFQAEDRGVKNGFQGRVQHLLPQLADGGMVREPVLERHPVHGHLGTSRACCIGSIVVNFGVIVSALCRRTDAPPC